MHLYIRTYTYTCTYMYIHVYIHIHICIYKGGLSFSKVTLTTLVRFGNRGMLASDDTYVWLGSCQILAKTCMQISLDFLDVTYFQYTDKEIGFFVRMTSWIYGTTSLTWIKRYFTRNKCQITRHQICYHLQVQYLNLSEYCIWDNIE